MACSRLAFSGTYNVVNSAEDAEKCAQFTSKSLERGARFILHNRSEMLRADQVSVADVFDRAGEWAGTVVYPPNLVRHETKAFVESMSDPEWKKTLSRWLPAVDQYDLWVTIDIPGRQRWSTIVISYWNFPVFEVDTWQGHEYSADEAAVALVEDIYDKADNLFSAFFFQLGEFSYPQHELRKLSFSYFWVGDHEHNDADLLHETYKPILRKTLLTNAKDDLLFTGVGDGRVLVSSRGFVGMTGQNQLGRAPELIACVARERDVANAGTDAGMRDFFRELSKIVKATSSLASLSEHLVPMIQRESDQALGNLRRLSGTAQHSLVDIELSKNVPELSVQVQKAELDDKSLFGAMQDVFQLRAYATNVLSNTIQSRSLIRDVCGEIGLPEGEFTRPRMTLAEHVASRLADLETGFTKIVEELLPLHSALSVNRLTLHSKYAALTSKTQPEDSQIALDTCFVLMPFRDEMDEIYREIILPALDGAEFALNCYRADELYGTAPIIQDIWKSIKRARLIIAELTGRNPNVLYELGLAHVLRKPAILITQSMDDVPFDLKHLRVISYSLGPRGLKRLSEDLVRTVEAVLKSDERQQVFS